MDDSTNSFAHHLAAAQFINDANKDFFRGNKLYDKAITLPFKPAQVRGNVLRHGCWLTRDNCCCNYFYGNGAHQNWNPNPYPSWLVVLQTHLEKICNIKPGFVNSCFVNWYESGKQALHWHADDEQLFYDEDDVPIISFTLDSNSRTFLLRDEESGEIFDVVLRNKDILFMFGRLQQFYKHSVARGDSSSDRINFTFRAIRQHVSCCPKARTN